MRSQAVEFRLLQLVLSQIGDERRTIALVHWDGSRLRVAWKHGRFASELGSAGEDVRVAVDGLLENARQLAADPRGQPPLPLSHVCPVREGMESILVWSPTRMGVTADPARHFQELVDALRLRGPGTRPDAASIMRRPNDVGYQVASFGDEIRLRLGDTDRVRTRVHVQGLRAYDSPLSWLNGRWHHSFPLNLARVSGAKLIDRFQATLGRIDVVVPGNDVGVILAIYPERTEIEAQLEDVERFVADRTRGNVECIHAPLRTGIRPTISFEDLESRITRDILGASTPS